MVVQRSAAEDLLTAFVNALLSAEGRRLSISSEAGAGKTMFGVRY